jgi:hypothetical protein
VSKKAPSPPRTTTPPNKGVDQRGSRRRSPGWTRLDRTVRCERRSRRSPAAPGFGPESGRSSGPDRTVRSLSMLRLLLRTSNLPNGLKFDFGFDDTCPLIYSLTDYSKNTHTWIRNDAESRKSVFRDCKCWWSVTFDSTADATSMPIRRQRRSRGDGASERTRHRHRWNRENDKVRPRHRYRVAQKATSPCNAKGNVTDRKRQRHRWNRENDKVRPRHRYRVTQKATSPSHAKGNVTVQRTRQRHRPQKATSPLESRKRQSPSKAPVPCNAKGNVTV